MEGISHPAFRARVAALGGVGLVCTEFVRVSRAPLSHEALRREVVRAPGVPLSVQVMGNDADKMADAAGCISIAGADVVDINLGCPMPRVVRKGVGAAMLKDPVLLYEVVSAMRAQVGGALSAKIRAGFDDADRVVEIARVVEKAGVDFIAVHPRRRKDFYLGVADWRIVRTLVDALDVPVVGNGDVWYAADILRMQEETGCAAVMVGRPAIRNPWIFAQAAALAEGRAPVEVSGRDVVGWLEALAGDFRGARKSNGRRGKNKRKGNLAGKLKEMLSFLARAVPDGGVFKTAVLRAPDAEAVLEVCEAMLGPLAPVELDLDAHGRHALEHSGSVEIDDRPIAEAS